MWVCSVLQSSDLFMRRFCSRFVHMYVCVGIRHLCKPTFLNNDVRILKVKKKRLNNIGLLSRIPTCKHSMVS